MTPDDRAVEVTMAALLIESDGSWGDYYSAAESVIDALEAAGLVIVERGATAAGDLEQIGWCAADRTPVPPAFIPMVHGYEPRSNEVAVYRRVAGAEGQKYASGGVIGRSRYVVGEVGPELRAVPPGSIGEA